MIDCIILAGGFGTRLRSVVFDRPKPLAEINGVPFLDLLVRRVSPVVQKIVFAVGYLGEQIAEKYPQHTCSFEDSPLGTGGAMKRALRLTTSKHVLVMNGDSYLEFDFEAFYAAHLAKEADLTLLYRSVPNASRYGALSMDGDRVVGFAEKNPTAKEGLINGGVYLLKSDLLLPFGEVFSLETDAFPLLLKKRIFGYPSQGIFIDIGTPESYVEAQSLLKPFTPINS